ncbi:Stage V sporulation protein K [Madurella mycetomatis]|uniref:Stage V sporulation protein K n=1 Tax=Madurella mycetomatis TaxID=100816 RepID=A0A175WCG3_9PEZI|nr:Stage V sporulation protein K [Madurella mycetomatis]
MAGPEENNRGPSESDTDSVDGVETVDVENSDSESPIATPPEPEVAEVIVVTEENGDTIQEAERANDKKTGTKVSVVDILSPLAHGPPPTVPLNPPTEATPVSETTVAASGVSTPELAEPCTGDRNQATVEPADAAAIHESPPAESSNTDAQFESVSAAAETADPDPKTEAAAAPVKPADPGVESGLTSTPVATSNADAQSASAATPETGDAEAKSEPVSAAAEPAAPDSELDCEYEGIAALFDEENQHDGPDSDRPAAPDSEPGCEYEGIAALFGEESQHEDPDSDEPATEGRDSAAEAEDAKDEKTEEVQDEEEEAEPEKQYNPFNPDVSDSEDSDSEDTPSDGAGDPKPLPSRPGMPLLPALGRRLLSKFADEANLLPVEREWERRKREFGEKSKALDQLMAMVGLEEVKEEFLAIKATIDAAKQRKGKLRRQDFNLVLTGNAGTGKRTLFNIYKDLLTECGLWRASPYLKKRSGFDFQADKDVENLHKQLRDFGDGLEIMVFIDAIEGAWSYVQTELLYCLERHADRLNLVVVLAGSVNGMTKFLGSRPNGRWVFPRRLELKDYNDEQLRLILIQLIRHNAFTVEGGEDGPYPRIAAKHVGRGRDSTGFANVYDLVLGFGKMVDRQAARLEKEGVRLSPDQRASAEEKAEEPAEAAKAAEDETSATTEDNQGASEKQDAKKDETTQEDDKTEKQPGETEDKADGKTDSSNEAKTEEKIDEKVDEKIEEKTKEGLDGKGENKAEKNVEERLEEGEQDGKEVGVEEKIADGAEGLKIENKDGMDEKRVEDKQETEAKLASNDEHKLNEADKSDGKSDEGMEPADTVQHEKESPQIESTGQIVSLGETEEASAEEKGRKLLGSDSPKETEESTINPPEQEPAPPANGESVDGSEDETAPLVDPRKKNDAEESKQDKSHEDEKPAVSQDESEQFRNAQKTDDETDSGVNKLGQAPAEDETPKPDLSLLTKEDVIGPEPEDIRSTSAAWKELEKMAGLENVKKAIGELLTRARANYRREILGKEPLQTTLNRVFLGPPGTGKTTVAKLYAQILAEIGLLSTKEVEFKTPDDFIGQYIGESEVKTSRILDSTIGKVLIIDDAHMFYHGSRAGSGSESDIFRLGVIDTIISKIHNKPGEDRCVILLGYTDMMEEMFQKVNPGLRRRFPLEDAFRFESYDDEHLNKILRLKMAKEDISASEEAMEVAAEVLRRARDRPNFGNGGDVDNLLNQAKTRFRERMAARKMAETEALKATGGDSDAAENGFPDPDKEATSEEEHIVLDRADFDPEWDRGMHASKKCQALFEGLIGFDSIIDQFQGYQRMAANLRRRGRDPREIVPFTFVFKGPPGTGKTHTARIVGQIFYDMGLLSTNEVIECSASHLIGQYLGHTAPKVINLFERALGKVLFIDEAYRLASGARGTGTNSYEAEAVGELVDCMTKPRYLKKMIIVLAGYDKDMDALLQVNAGLRGRFATEIVFPPMSASRSKEHLLSLLRKEEIELRDVVDPGEEEKDKVLRLLHKLGMTAGWSNGRDIKTLAGIITGSVYKNAALEDIEAEEPGGEAAMFRISTVELNGFLKDMLRQRIRGGLAS